MYRRHPTSTRTATLLPYTPLFRTSDTHAPSEYLQCGISMGPYITRAHRVVFLSPPLTMGLMLTSSPQGSRSHYSQGRTFCTCPKSTATKQLSIFVKRAKS